MNNKVPAIVNTSDHAEELGFDQGRLAALAQAISTDVDRCQYDGARIILARGGDIALDGTIGYCDRDEAKALKPDDVFCIMSLTKSWTAAAALNRVERGDVQLTTRVADVIPGFAANGKHRITVAHLLTHTSGMPLGLPPLPVEQMGDLEANVQAICGMGPQSTPGEVVSYSASIGYTLLGEIVRRVDGGHRSLRQIFLEDILQPLAMKDSGLSSRKELESRRVPVVIRDAAPNVFGGSLLVRMNTLVHETSEIPSGGALSTGPDIFRFAEMLRRGGELDGRRILSPATVRLATSNHTGLRPNNLMVMTRELEGMDPYPAYLGLGFMLRGSGIFLTPLGILSSPGTFGALGIGSMVFWVDPERDLTFVCLTSGLLGQFNNYHRFQRLSDMAQAALVQL